MALNTWSLCSSLTYESNYVPWRTIVSPTYDNGGDEKFTTFRDWYPYLNNQTNYNHVEYNPFEKRDLYQCDDQAFYDAVNSGDQEVRERERERDGEKRNNKGINSVTPSSNRSSLHLSSPPSSLELCPTISTSLR